ncbi:MAG: radical SAM protein [Kiritimatiellae bacterium]|nr:radical SAM protein [Kiritimatiellia bacterium]MDD5521310.1 radical SAM protein [Kiritimatiellia bacterium]
MKVLFIQFSGMQESIGVASLASSLEKAGHESELLLLSHCEDLSKDIKCFNPGLIAFSVNTGSHREVMALARFLKERVKIPMIMGGPHATFFAEEVASQEGVDYICRGEGDEALVGLVDSLQQGTDSDHIDNLWIRKPDGWIRNDIGNLVEDLDSRPMPKRELYYKYGFLRDMPMKRFITGLGCPYSCAFCFNTQIKRDYEGKGKFLRRKSVDRVIDEIIYVKKISPLTRVHFSDDIFTLNVKWLSEFVEKYRAKVGLPFSCGTRLDCSAEIVEILAKAGCAAVQLGFESGSPRVRKECLRKMWTNEQAMALVERFKKYGIETMSMNMIALPGETMEEIFETVEWNYRIGYKYVRCGFFTPYPKLDLTNLAISKSLLESDFSLKDYDPNPLIPMFNRGRSTELINLVNLFYPAVKFPFLRKVIINHLIKLKPNKLFFFIGSLNVLQEFFYFRLTLFSAWKYFKNTMGSFTGFRWGSWPATRILKEKGMAIDSKFATE